MVLNRNWVSDSFNTWIADSGNTENTTTTDIGVTDSFNYDDSVNDSFNTSVDVDDSFNRDSHDLDVDIDDSFNTDSSVNDDSINAGNREYNTGFGGGGAGAGVAAADAGYGGHGGHGHHGGGDLSIDARSTVVDQSVNANIAAFGPVGIISGNEANVASGDESIAIGGDYTQIHSIDESTNILAGGDVNIGNETTITATIGSYNEYTDNSTTDVSWHSIDIDDSFNDYSETYTATDSFNLDASQYTSTDVDVDVNAIVASSQSAIVDDVDVTL